MLRAPHPRFTVDVEHDEPLIPSKPVTAVELPAGDGLIETLITYLSSLPETTTV